MYRSRSLQARDPKFVDRLLHRPEDAITLVDKSLERLLIRRLQLISHPAMMAKAGRLYLYRVFVFLFEAIVGIVEINTTSYR